jgi:hypothetical protein
VGLSSRSTLITASSSRVLLINGAQACNVYWQVGSSATLGRNRLRKPQSAHRRLRLGDTEEGDGAGPAASLPILDHPVVDLDQS